MKIVCDSCATKYSIADDKVKGKVFKIRCKKCSHIIVVRGTSDAPVAAPAPAAAPDAVWHIVVDGEQVGPLPNSDIKARLGRGELTPDTYIWKEGFADWLKIASVPEFAGSGGASAAGDMFSDGERTVAHVPDAPLLRQATAPARSSAGSNGGGLFGTGDGSSDPFAAQPAKAPAAAASAFGGGGDDDVFGPPAAAPSRGASSDLFASPAMAPAPFASPVGRGGGGGGGEMQAAAHDGGRIENLTAQRSENSVLFSLSNLQSLAMPSSAPSSGPKPGHANSQTDGSGLIDIRAMAATTLGSPSGDSRRDDELPAFGTGFSPVASVLLPPTQSSGMPKWILAVVAVCLLLLAGIGVMAYALLAKKPAPEIAAVDPAAPAAPVAAPGAAPGTPSAPIAANTPPTTAPPGPENLPPRDDVKADEDKKPSSRSSSRSSSRDKGKKGDKEPSGGGKEESPKAAAAAKEDAPTKEEAPKPAAKKSGGDSLDDLLQGAIQGKTRPTPKMDDESKKAAEPASAGPLAKNAVVAGMKGVTPKISECYQQYKVPGMIMINTVIGKNGKVSSATATGKFAGTPTGSCVEKAVKSASFPPSDGLTTPYPFILK